MAMSSLQLQVGVQTRHACQLNYYFHCNVTLMCALRFFVGRSVIGHSVCHYRPVFKRSACSVTLADCKGSQVQHREVVKPEVKVVESCVCSFLKFGFLSCPVLNNVRNTLCCKLTRENAKIAMFVLFVFLSVCFCAVSV